MYNFVGSNPEIILRIITLGFFFWLRIWKKLCFPINAKLSSHSKLYCNLFSFKWNCLTCRLLKNSKISHISRLKLFLVFAAISSFTSFLVPIRICCHALNYIVYFCQNTKNLQDYRVQKKNMLNSSFGRKNSFAAFVAQTDMSFAVLLEFSTIWFSGWQFFRVFRSIWEIFCEFGVLGCCTKMH